MYLCALTASCEDRRPLPTRIRLLRNSSLLVFAPAWRCYCMVVETFRNCSRMASKRFEHKQNVMHTKKSNRLKSIFGLKDVSKCFLCIRFITFMGAQRRVSYNVLKYYAWERKHFLSWELQKITSLMYTNLWMFLSVTIEERFHWLFLEYIMVGIQFAYTCFCYTGQSYKPRANYQVVKNNLFFKMFMHEIWFL